MGRNENLAFSCEYNRLRVPDFSGARVQGCAVAADRGLLRFRAVVLDVLH
jgi:hypothetical protein